MPVTQADINNALATVDAQYYSFTNDPNFQGAISLFDTISKLNYLGQDNFNSQRGFYNYQVISQQYNQTKKHHDLYNSFYGYVHETRTVLRKFLTFLQAEPDDYEAVKSEIVPSRNNSNLSTDNFLNAYPFFNAGYISYLEAFFNTYIPVIENAFSTIRTYYLEQKTNRQSSEAGQGEVLNAQSIDTPNVNSGENNIGNADATDAGFDPRDAADVAREDERLLNSKAPELTGKPTSKPTLSVDGPCLSAACADGWGVKFEGSSKSYYLKLLPARSSINSAKDIPNSLPGLAFKFKHNVRKIRIPGSVPVYQQLGVDSLLINIVGMFTGEDGEDVSKFTKLPSNFLDGKATGLHDMGNSYRSYQDFYNLAIRNRQELKVTINMQSNKANGEAGIFADDVGNPEFSGLIKNMEVYHARAGRTYYAMQFEATKISKERASCNLKKLEYKPNAVDLNEAIRALNTNTLNSSEAEFGEAAFINPGEEIGDEKLGLLLDFFSRFNNKTKFWKLNGDKYQGYLYTLNGSENGSEWYAALCDFNKQQLDQRVDKNGNPDQENLQRLAYACNLRKIPENLVEDYKRARSGRFHSGEILLGVIASLSCIKAVASAITSALAVIGDPTKVGAAASLGYTGLASLTCWSATATFAQSLNEDLSAGEVAGSLAFTAFIALLPGIGQLLKTRSLSSTKTFLKSRYGQDAGKVLGHMRRIYAQANKNPVVKKFFSDANRNLAPVTNTVRRAANTIQRGARNIQKSFNQVFRPNRNFPLNANTIPNIKSPNVNVIPQSQVPNVANSNTAQSLINQPVMQAPRVGNVSRSAREARRQVSRINSQAPIPQASAIRNNLPFNISPNLSNARALKLKNELPRFLNKPNTTTFINNNVTNSLDEVQEILNISDDFIMYVPRGSTASKTVPLNNIHNINVKIGNNSLINAISF